MKLRRLLPKRGQGLVREIVSRLLSDLTVHRGAACRSRAGDATWGDSELAVGYPILAPQPAGQADILQAVRWAKAHEQAGEGSAAIGPITVVDVVQGGPNTADTVDQCLSSLARFASPERR